MNSEIEKEGCNIGQMDFSFDQGREDFNNFSKMNPDLSPNDIFTTLNICKSRGYIKHLYLGAGNYSGLSLTEDGQGLAISSMKAKSQRPVHEGSSKIIIKNFNNSGAAQIGNNNYQTIENAFNTIIKSIEESNASNEEKHEAKSKLKDFLQHPLVSTLIGAGVSSLLSII